MNRYCFKILCYSLLLPLVSCGQRTPDQNIEVFKKEGKVCLRYGGQERLSGLMPASAQATAKQGNILVTNSYSKTETINSEYSLECFFKSIPHYKQGMSIWRYKPWNAWSKPILINSPDSLPDWDVQLFYWQYEDGVYGAAIPLNDKSYRGTIGRAGSSFGVKSAAYAPVSESKDIAQMLVGFGKDPYALLKSLYTDGMEIMGCPENLIGQKEYPEVLDYLGWCTWNASNMGQHLDEQHILQGVESFQKKDIPLGWIIIDDGWQDSSNQSLNAYTPNKTKFPDGFKEMNRKLTEEYGLHGVGIWNAFDGHWKGINPESPLGKSYANQLFSWHQQGPLDKESEECFFVRPDAGDAMDRFFDDWLAYEREQGFTFVKVDNQLVVERMAVNNYPIDYLSKRMHQAMYNAIFKHIDGAVINCMDMTTEAYFNFGHSAVARAVEDYFPEKDDGVGYNMERGGAAAHLVMALYNNLYFSQMVYTDFDMFESYHTDGVFHAFTRALNNGPVYVTDRIGQQNAGVLLPMVYSDGKLIRPLTPLTLTEDCLFLGQGAKPTKAFSKNRFGSALCLWNMSDADQVEGSFALSDIYQLEGTDNGFITYEYFTGKLAETILDEKHPVQLPRMGYAMYHVYPLQAFCTPLGLIDKYNVSGTLINQHIEASQAEVTVGDGGTFAAYARQKPAKVILDGQETDFEYADKLLKIHIPTRLNERMGHTISIIK